MLKSNPDIALRDKWGKTPLYVAASRGSDRYVEHLLCQQPDAIDIPKNNGKTPLYIAAYRRYAGVVKILLDNQASWQEALIFAAKTENGTLDQIFKILLENGLRIH